MSNVIALRPQQRRKPFAERTTALAAVFARTRRVPDDVFWLKENAEFLNITECTGTGLAPSALEHWSEFYDQLPSRLGFFPQYYRFLLSIALDLEDLGMDGSVGEHACAQAAKQGWAEAELSDLQRGEARRLLARRGAKTVAADPWLDDRLRAFVSRAGTFSLPNKKAAYELTHIVFYLSEYGRRDPALPDDAIVSLQYAGVLAMLEQNMDLLAEICVALRYAGRVPPAAWEGRVIRGLRYFDTESGPDVRIADDYHEFLVSTWAACVAGDAAMAPVVMPERTGFHRSAAVSAGPLRALSTALYDLGHARSGDWQGMKQWVYDRMSGDEQAILAEAEASTPYFDGFFEGFARAHA